MDVTKIVKEIDQAFEHALMKPVSLEENQEIRQAAQHALFGVTGAEDLIATQIKAKEKMTVTLRLPVGIVDEVKARAANAGVPWSSYISMILERAIAK